MNINNGGLIEVIHGPMFSGKTDELLKRLKRHVIAGRRVVLLKPAIDTRFGSNECKTHDGVSLPAITFSNTSEVWKKVEMDQVDVVGLDEAQFVEDLKGFAMQLMRLGKIFIAAGLDFDYKFEPFLNVWELIDSPIVKKTQCFAYCVYQQCGDEARWSKKIARDDGRIQIGDKKDYEARCTKHRGL
jgi:thymidine kinase